MPQSRIVGYLSSQEPFGWGEPPPDCGPIVHQPPAISFPDFQLSFPQLAPSEIDRLKERVSDLERQIALLMTAAGPHLQRGDTAEFTCDSLQEIVNITAEIFPGELRITNSADPEMPQDVYQVFAVSVPASADAEELVDRRLQWHRRIATIAPSMKGRIRLAIERR